MVMHRCIKREERMKNSFREVGRSSFLTKKDPAHFAQDPLGLWVHRELVGKDAQRSPGFLRREGSCR